MTTTSKFKTREFIPSDKNFIFSSWLKGLYYGSDYFGEIPQDLFFKNYQRVIEEILSRQETIIVVAHLPDVEDVILGYAVYSPRSVHWIFVKDSWRKMGIMKALVPEGIRECSHLTKVGKYLKNKHAVIFNPFI